MLVKLLFFALKFIYVPSPVRILNNNALLDRTAPLPAAAEAGQLCPGKNLYGTKWPLQIYCARPSDMITRLSLLGPIYL